MLDKLPTDILYQIVRTFSSSISNATSSKDARTSLELLKGLRSFILTCRATYNVWQPIRDNEEVLKRFIREALGDCHLVLALQLSERDLKSSLGLPLPLPVYADYYFSEDRRKQQECLSQYVPEMVPSWNANVLIGAFKMHYLLLKLFHIYFEVIVKVKEGLDYERAIEALYVFAVYGDTVGGGDYRRAKTAANKSIDEELRHVVAEELRKFRSRCSYQLEGILNCTGLTEDRLNEIYSEAYTFLNFQKPGVWECLGDLLMVWEPGTPARTKSEGFSGEISEYDGFMLRKITKCLGYFARWALERGMERDLAERFMAGVANLRDLVTPARSYEERHALRDMIKKKEDDPPIMLGFYDWESRQWMNYASVGYA